MTRLILNIVAILVLLNLATALRGEDLNVPPEKIEGGSPDGMMHRYLARQADQAVKRWTETYEKVKRPEQIAAYQKLARENCLKVIGAFPERTPLEPQVVGTISRPGYTVEKIIFQSQPKLYVTGLLFLPDAANFKPPYPAVLVPCGHAMEAKGYADYQSMGALLALNGMVALVYDPIDQGERGQYLGEGGWPKLWGIEAHSMVGLGSILLGQNVAKYEIWDGIRAIDYLQSRPEVDPKRIGCTGNSGGGTQTSYLMAFDDRINAAAVSCYLMGIRKLLPTLGCQDSEQHLFGQLAYGVDHADFVTMRAPSPVLILCATHDFFDVGGTWETFRFAKRFYTRQGFAERVDILENDAGHNYDKTQREGVARWMSRWLLNKDQPIVEPPLTLLNEKEYQCTTDAKVMSLPDARSVYDLNIDIEKKLAEKRSGAWKPGDRKALLEQVRKLNGIRALSELPEPKVESLGTVARAGYKIEMLLIKPEEGIALPALFFTPDKANPKSIWLYVNQKGKTADVDDNVPIERLVKSGDAVLSVDLRGTGQTQARVDGKWYPPEYQDGYYAYLLGRSYVGMRTEDILVCARYAAKIAPEGPVTAVNLLAVGNVGIPALHAAALEPGLFQEVLIKKSLVSWSAVIHNRLNKGLETCFVHGALEIYDLPNLADTLGDKLTLLHPYDGVVEQPKKP